MTNQKRTLTTEHPIGAQVGDTLSIEGVYEKRTFWQWLTRRPRKLTLFTVTAVVGNTMELDQ